MGFFAQLLGFCLLFFKRYNDSEKINAKHLCICVFSLSKPKQRQKLNKIQDVDLQPLPLAMIWVPASLHVNHFPRGTLKSFSVRLDFSGWLKVKMSKAYGLHPRMLPDDCEKWPYAALIIQEGGCCKACPDGCLGQRGKSRWWGHGNEVLTQNKKENILLKP